MSEQNGNGMAELYRVHRPKTFKGVLGQNAAVKTISGWFKSGRVPHAILLSGPPGTGKTTLARIIRDKLGCSDMDYCEINAAKERGIDVVRDVSQRMSLAPMGGKARVWLWDEAHQLVKREGGDAQTALLKMLEDPPPHAYFLFCTTHPQGLLPTIRSRCSEVKLKALSTTEVLSLLERVAEQEGIEQDEALFARIVEAAEGSARKALVLLSQVLAIEDPRERADAVLPADTKKDSFELVRMLLWKKEKWSQVAAFIKGMEGEDWEGFRRLVLSCASGECLKGGSGAERAYRTLMAFEPPWYDCGKAGLVRACYEVYHR